MFANDTEVPSGTELLAEPGLDARAICHILDEPAAFDPRGDEAEREEGLKRIRRRGLPWCSSGADPPYAVSGAALDSVSPWCSPMVSGRSGARPRVNHSEFPGHRYLWAPPLPGWKIWT